MKKYIIITADTNDGDYVTEKTELLEGWLEEIQPVIDAIKAFEPYNSAAPDGYPWTNTNNYPVGECVREDLGEKSAEDLYGSIPGFELFSELVPYAEYGIHTIESIELLEVTNETKLL